MGIEIERKFLVRDPSILRGLTGVAYRQGYLSTVPERTVRVRRMGDRAVITVKGVSHGASRAEYEYPIPPADADEMLDRLALRPLIEKTRYRLTQAGFVWEIDVFAGVNAGLVVAEVELPSETIEIELPGWLGPEVTEDGRYANAALVAKPYSSWQAEGDRAPNADAPDSKAGPGSGA